MFDDIPDGCVAHILERLLSVHDVFNFQRTCSRFAAIGRTHQATWRAPREHALQVAELGLLGLGHARDDVRLVLLGALVLLLLRARCGQGMHYRGQGALRTGARACSDAALVCCSPACESGRSTARMCA